MRPKKTHEQKIEYLWSKIWQQDGHWLWRGEIVGRGYGRATVDGKRIMAHRLSYELTFGPIPEGLTLDHLCKVKNCVRPTHLEAVTNRENILRSDGITARAARQTHCKNGHPLSGPNLRQDKRQRNCRRCHADLTLRRYHEQKSGTTLEHCE